MTRIHLTGLIVFFCLFSCNSNPKVEKNSVSENGEIIRDSISWNRPRFEEGKEERLRMVRDYIRNSFYQPVKDPKVLEAMKNVPRHLFVPKVFRDQAYENTPLPIGYGQTISQPIIVAQMTELLDIKPGDKILEIGTGSGYQAAVLSELTPYVYTVEIVRELGEQAKARFSTLGYNTIKVKIGDGYEGWPEYAPFDGIIVTCAPEEIPKPLIEQLKPGGRIVIPVGKAGKTQLLVLVEKSSDGKIKEQVQFPVVFVPMTGKAQKKE